MSVALLVFQLIDLTQLLPKLSNLLHTLLFDEVMVAQIPSDNWPAASALCCGSQTVSTDAFVVGCGSHTFSEALSTC